MPDTSPALSLPYLLPSQAQKHVTHNEALARLDALVQLAVESRTETAPPAAPASGARYLVAEGATGAWAGQALAIAVWTGGLWEFTAPLPGWVAYVRDEALQAVFTGADWADVVPDLKNLDGLGVNADYDPVNRISVSSEATLLSHAGAGHQLKINKATTPDTASVLFQSNWSGRAEFGLTGGDNFAVKVSPDGSAWTQALSFAAGTGITSARGLRSGTLDIARDTVGSIPTPAAGGLVFLTVIDATFPQSEHSGIYAYDAGQSLKLTQLCAGSKMQNLNDVAMTGTTAINGNTGVSVQADTLRIENRGGTLWTYSYTFLC